MRTTDVVKWFDRSTGIGLATLATVAACGGTVAPPHAPPSADTRRLAGVWNATFVLDAPPLGFDSAALRALPERRVRGTLIFVPNRWLTSAAVTGVGLAAPTLYGTYDVDFRPFGFDPRDADRVPDVVATAPTSSGPASADSVTLVLGPSSDREQVMLAGVSRADSVVGTWRLQGAGRTGVAAWGRFVLVPPRPAAPPPAALPRATLGVRARGLLHRAGGDPASMR